MRNHRVAKRVPNREQMLISVILFFILGDSARCTEPFPNGDRATIPANPILGPFLPAGHQLAQFATELTTHGGSDISEYGHLFNMRSVSGFGAEAGAKTNLGVFTYAQEFSGNVWGGAIDLQLSNSNKRINANTLEVDLNNYRMDYKKPGSSAAVGLQLFLGGPNRSSTAIAIGEQGSPRDTAHVINGLTLCCATLISDSSILDLTNSSVSIDIRGSHKTGLDFKSAANFSAFQINGKGWNVNPEGLVTARAFVGTLQRPSSSREPCTLGQFEDDENFHYVCVAHATWKRVRLQDF